MKINWTDTAMHNLQAIHDYMSSISPPIRLVCTANGGSADTAVRADHPVPNVGRKVPEYDHEQIQEVVEGAYRIIYHIRPDQIDILAVIHGSMPLP